MTAEQIQRIALSVGSPPYSIEGIMRIQKAICKQSGEYISYGHVSAAVAGIERQAKQEQAPKPAVKVKMRPCKYCGEEFPATGQQKVCRECKAQITRRNAEKAREKYMAKRAAGG